MNTVPTLGREIPENQISQILVSIFQVILLHSKLNKDACTMLFKNCILTLIWALGAVVTAGLAALRQSTVISNFASGFSHVSAAKTVKRDTVFKNGTLLNKIAQNVILRIFFSLSKNTKSRFLNRTVILKKMRAIYL